MENQIHAKNVEVREKVVWGLGHMIFSQMFVSIITPTQKIYSLWTKYPSKKVNSTKFESFAMQGKDEAKILVENTALL